MANQPFNRSPFPVVVDNQITKQQPMPGRRTPRLLLGMGLLLLTLLLGACGIFGSSAKSADPVDAEAQTHAIARDFAADGDLEKARTAVNALAVANPGQWLIFMTEGAVADPSRDTALTQALVKLTLGLGYDEETIDTYAAANGLADTAGNLAGSQAAADAATVAAAIAAPLPAAPTTAAPVAAAPSVAETAPVTTAARTGDATALLATGPAADAQPAQAVAESPTAAPTAPTAPAAPSATASELVNLRGGPGVEYALAGSLGPGETATIIGRNATGDWWQISTSGGATAWVYGQLITPSGPTESVAVAADIPAAPTATPAPVAAAPVEAPAAPVEAPTAVPDAAPPAPAADPSGQPTFRMIDRHMWAKADNGECQGQHLLRIIVVDANNNPLNGITLQGIYTGAILVTGSQGKGDGRIEYDLYGTGEGFRVIKDVDGRDAISDNAEGFTTKSLDIDQATLIAGGYCTNDSDCQDFYNSYGCTGHHSWQATFQRNF